MFGDPLDALAIGVDQPGARLVVRLQVLVVEARPLAQLPVPGLERLRGLRILDDRVDARTDLVHLLVIGVLVRGEHVLERALLRRQHREAAARRDARDPSIRP